MPATTFSPDLRARLLACPSTLGPHNFAVLQAIAAGAKKLPRDRYCRQLCTRSLVKGGPDGFLVLTEHGEIELGRPRP
jgi:hypothetical protein